MQQTSYVLKSVIMFWVVSFCFFSPLAVMRIGDPSLLCHRCSCAEILVLLGKSCLCADTAAFTFKLEECGGVCILNYT